MNTENKKLQLANEYLEYSINLRRDFHQYPELGFQEFRTSEIIAKELENLGYVVIKNIGKTGVIGILQGKLEGPTILLRFDMDALPILEENEKEYVSKNPGIMHACGHDGHMAIGLTVAKILSTFKNEIKGTIKFIFQPAEEGLGGALATIDDGVLENPKPDYCLGLHLWNEKPLGWIGFNSGAMMAAADTFEIIVSGKGGHGGLPHKAIDPIVTAASIITSAQTIISRNVSPFENAVVSFGSIQGGSTFNVIPNSVQLTGTIRTFDLNIRKNIFDRLEKIIYSISESMGCHASFRIDEVTPAVINDSNVISVLKSVCKEQLPGFSLEDNFRTMGSEDFSLFLNQIPGCFFFVGSANSEKNLIFGHHHPRFDFDENVFPIAVSCLLGMVEKISGFSIS